ncbi:agglutinin alpha chain-like [Bidens hawaiensis]|uniref:agglutinin alpha chain-like n=1 Tax=Bidens hawaiensis TaxID=980011 RepID=UPI00404A4729
MLEQMKPCSRKVFINIALQCLAENRKDRPRIGVIVKDLDIALEHQLDTRIIDSVSEVGLRTKLWGSMTGGFLFYFRLESNQKLRKIKINHGEWIHSLTFEAEDSNCLLHASRRYGGPHDGTDKTQMTPIDFDAEEEIIKIYGTVGSRENLYLVTTLCFVTNKNEYGPFGEKCDDDTHFSESWKMGLFDGFYGRYGWYLDALGCCLKTN